ncbi:5-hydroxyisourate hydrolase-like [Ciconia maguari]
MSETVNGSLTTHVLNTATGLPAAGLAIRLAQLQEPGPQWTELVQRWTDEDGRCLPLLAPGQAKAGTYKLRFETAAYWQGLGHASFYPFVEVRGAGEPATGAGRGRSHRGTSLQGSGCRSLWELPAPSSLPRRCRLCSERPPGPGCGAPPERGPSLLALPQVVFTIADPAQKLHLPLLISPYSYTTYRGS